MRGVDLNHRPLGYELAYALRFNYLTWHGWERKLNNTNSEQFCLQTNGSAKGALLFVYFSFYVLENVRQAPAKINRKSSSRLHCQLLTFGQESQGSRHAFMRMSTPRYLPAGDASRKSILRGSSRGGLGVQRERVSHRLAQDHWWDPAAPLGFKLPDVTLGNLAALVAELGKSLESLLDGTIGSLAPKQQNGTRERHRLSVKLKLIEHLNHRCEAFLVA